MSLVQRSDDTNISTGLIGAFFQRAFVVLIQAEMVSFIQSVHYKRFHCTMCTAQEWIFASCLNCDLVSSPQMAKLFATARHNVTTNAKKVRLLHVYMMECVTTICADQLSISCSIWPFLLWVGLCLLWVCV